ncbi:Uncharacterised protein [Chlamydia abortus]|nr:Uncharacterised protein [Chlamydia abortus]
MVSVANSVLRRMNIKESRLGLDSHAIAAFVPQCTRLPARGVWFGFAWRWSTTGWIGKLEIEHELSRTFCPGPLLSGNSPGVRCGHMAGRQPSSVNFMPIAWLPINCENQDGTKNCPVRGYKELQTPYLVQKEPFGKLTNLDKLIYKNQEQLNEFG